MVLLYLVFLLLGIQRADGTWRLRNNRGADLSNSAALVEARRSSEMSMKRPKIIHLRSDGKLSTLLKKSLQHPGTLNWQSDSSSNKAPKEVLQKLRRSTEKTLKHPGTLNWRSDIVLDAALRQSLRRRSENLLERPGKLNWRLDSSDNVARHDSDKSLEHPGSLNWRSDSMAKSLLDKTSEYGWKLNENGVGQLCNSHPIKMCSGKKLKDCWRVKEIHCFTMQATNGKKKPK